MKANLSILATTLLLAVVDREGGVRAATTTSGEPRRVDPASAARNGHGRQQQQHRRHLGTDSFYPSSDPFSWNAKLPTSTLPQFIVLSITGGVTPLAYDLYRQLADIRHRDGCPIEATWYISIAQNSDADPYTICNIIRGLRKLKHELATNTYGPTPDPTEEEIMKAPLWLNETCGVPLEEMVGFRTPNLGFKQRTFDSLKKLGFLYDSSISDGELNANGGRSALWPYTMDWGIGVAQDCSMSAGSCNSTKPNAGLWEVPLWRMFDEDDQPLIPVDFQEDAYTTLKRNFERRYEGNRAPLAINMNAGWLMTQGDSLRKWAEEVLDDHDDVFFVTTSGLIEWMRTPVSAEEFTRDCTGHITDCFPPTYEAGGCGNGEYDTNECKCVCNYPFIGTNCLDSLVEWTYAPTVRPTHNPTVSPTLEPTEAPTISKSPTVSPTFVPTAVPTVTAQPTKPTEAPTRNPTDPPINVRGRSGGARGGGGGGGQLVWAAAGALLLLHSAVFL